MRFYFKYTKTEWVVKQTKNSDQFSEGNDRLYIFNKDGKTSYLDLDHNTQ